MHHLKTAIGIILVGALFWVGFQFAPLILVIACSLLLVFWVLRFLVKQIGSANSDASRAYQAAIAADSRSDLVMRCGVPPQEIRQIQTATPFELRCYLKINNRAKQIMYSPYGAGNLLDLQKQIFEDIKVSAKTELMIQRDIEVKISKYVIDTQRNLTAYEASFEKTASFRHPIVRKIIIIARCFIMNTPWSIFCAKEKYLEDSIKRSEHNSPPASIA